MSAGRGGLALEWFGLFVLLPAGLAWRPDVVPWVWPFALVFVYALVRLLRYSPRRKADLWSAQPGRERAYLPPVLIRTAVGIGVLAGLMFWLYPEHWLALPKQRPRLWGVLMVLYPIFSVYPQEVVFRAFFFRRYAALFPRPFGLIVASAASFAWMHIVFANGPAVALTLLGGVLFSLTYMKSGSLRLVCLEHMLYGQAIFTLGLGPWFYDPRLFAV